MSPARRAKVMRTILSAQVRPVPWDRRHAGEAGARDARINGSRGLNRVPTHVRHAPSAALEHCRPLLRRPRRPGWLVR